MNTSFKDYLSESKAGKSGREDKILKDIENMVKLINNKKRKYSDWASPDLFRLAANMEELLFVMGEMDESKFKYSK